MSTEFTWGYPEGELLTRQVTEGRRFAYEFDMKLRNASNFSSIPFGLGCPNWDKNDFWIAQRDNVWIETNIPDYIHVYWDVATLDSCDVKDLSWGVYHPEYILDGASYWVNLYWENAAGDEPWSTFEWGVPAAPACTPDRGARMRGSVLREYPGI